MIGSSIQKIYVFENRDGVVYWTDTVTLPELEDSYVRSISIIDGKLATVSGPGSINIYEMNENNTFTLSEKYKVPPKYYGMNGIVKIGSFYYCTVNTDLEGDVSAATIFRVKDLADITVDAVEDLKQQLGFETQPYFLTFFDDSWYCTEISASGQNGIMRFEIDEQNEQELKNIEWLWKFEAPESSNIDRYNSHYANNNQIVDLVLFAGQSNMAGHGDAALAPSVEKGYEFRAISDASRLYDISEPFGIYENKAGGINDTFENMTVFRKSGGMVSSFANAYYEKTGVPIVGVSCSEGATQIASWLPGTEKYDDLVNRYHLAKQFLAESKEFTLRHVLLVWCQGESDGDTGTSADEYYHAMDQLVNALTNEGIEAVLVVRIGNRGDDALKYDNIISAQTQYCLANSKCVLVSTRFAEMYKTGLMADEYHYLQEGYNLVGTEAGENAGYYVDTGFEPSLHDYEYDNEYRVE